MTAGLKTIIALSFVCTGSLPHLQDRYLYTNGQKLIIHHVLAVGFLLVILSCALWKAYYPLLVVATYVLAPIPNWVCGRCANPDDFGTDGSGNALIDFGKFVTGFLVVMGVGK